MAFRLNPKLGAVLGILAALHSGAGRAAPATPSFLIEADAQIVALETDAAGDLYLAGSLPPESPRSDDDRSDAFVAKISRDSSQLLYWTVLAGSGSDGATALSVDEQGAAYVTGTTASRDFPVTASALQPDFQADAGHAFAAKLDAEGNLVFVTFIGGSSNTTGTDILALPSGESIVTGQSVGGEFPASAGAAVASDAPNTEYLVKLDRAGAELVFAVRGIGGGRLARDLEGNVFVAGAAWGGSDFPATDGAFQVEHPLRACAGTPFFGVPCRYGYVVKLGPSAEEILFATFVTGTFGSTISGLHIDEQGNALISGTTNSPDFPVTPGAFLEEYFPNAEAPPLDVPGRASVNPPPATGFVAKLTGDGSDLIFSTFFGGSETDSISDLQVVDGAIYIAGTASSADIPGLDSPFQCFPSGYVAQLSPDGDSLLARRLLPGGPGSPRMALRGAESVYVATGSSGGLPAKVELSGTPASVACVLDAATLTHVASLAPGRLLSLFGSALTPVEAVGLSDSGLLPTSLEGLIVSFDGTPAPLLYVSPRQVNVQVPFEVFPGDAVEMLLEGASGFTQSFRVEERRPSAFLNFAPEAGCPALSSYTPLALNEDGSWNSCDNPAATGSVATIFLQGIGATDPPLMTGAVLHDDGLDLDSPVTFQGSDIEIISARSLWGAVSGVWEIRFRVPAGPDPLVRLNPRVDGILVSPGPLALWAAP